MLTEHEEDFEVPVNAVAVAVYLCRWLLVLTANYTNATEHVSTDEICFCCKQNLNVALGMLLYTALSVETGNQRFTHSFNACSACAS